jgi:hypothetical protein
MRKVALLLVLIAAASSVRGAELSENIDRTFNVKPGSSFVLTNVNGRVTVNSWDQPRVHVVARKEVEASSSVLKDVMRELQVEFQQRDGGLVVKTHMPKRTEGGTALFSWLTGDRVEAQVEYQITVPRTMNLDVETVNGAVLVTGVNGRHEVETTNGRIEIARCAGSIHASTTNGSIEAELLTVAKGQPLELETTNGRIEVSVPATLAVDVDADTMNGGVRTDLPISTTRVSRTSLRGTMNGGGAPLKLRTVNGGIAIKSIGS